MSTQHEALELASDIDEKRLFSCAQAADTIRQQHSLIVQMATALDAISDDMTVGDRWTNAGQYLLDSLAAAKEYLK